MLALIAVALLGRFVLPSIVHVERQSLINASFNTIFAEVSDFNRWIDAIFTLEPNDGNTLVIWILDIDMREGGPLLSKPMSTSFGFFMDAMIGRKYEEGLVKLNAVVEG